MNEKQPFAVVNYLLNKKGLSKEEIAVAAGVSVRMVDYTLSGGEKQLSSKAIARIAESIGTSQTQLVSSALADASSLPAYDEIVFVPKMAAHPRGGNGGHEIEEEVTASFSFLKNWIRTKGNPKDMRLFEVVGESMAPTINEGDMVLVNHTRTDWIVGKIYLVTLNDAFMIKRASMKPGHLVLVSDNRDKDTYPNIDIPIDTPDYFVIHGMVLWGCREY